MITIRPELPEDAPKIHTVITGAFTNHPHSDGSEPLIVERLRQAGRLTHSLVAVDSAVIGHIAFSPVTIEDGTPDWFGLGPVSVMPNRQGEGIGGMLVREGLARLKAEGAAGCVVLGNPDYYGRFGFQHDAGLRYPGPPPASFQRLVLDGANPSGVVCYDPAFG